MVPFNKLKKYFWSLFGVLGIVFFWAGIWDGVGGLPYISIPWVSLLVGLAIILFSGLIFKQIDPFGGEEITKISDALHQVHLHPLKQEFTIHYYDKIKKKNILVSAEKLDRIEKETFLVLKQADREFFIPFNRVKEIWHQGKPWEMEK
ncbi:MAG TPA: hypothetical protein VJA23_01375 [Candidatus Nanoarchaeia archaeon]|nr:hypothetical protein [Candidatus Nanoarchaeia archaeon]